MYLVELRPGKEELYRTGDELAAAIRSGDVDTHSRIYHRATSKWISVTLHPQFKAIAATKASEPAPPPAPLPPPDRISWTYFNGPGLDDLPSEEPAESPESDRHEPLPVDDPSLGQSWRRPLALSVTGLFLILGVQLAFSGPRPPWSARPSGDADEDLVPASVRSPAPRPEIVSLASTTTSGSWNGGARPDLPSEEPRDTASGEMDESDLVPSKPAIPNPPRIRAKALREALPVAPAPAAGEARTVADLLSRYSAAYDSAHARLESGIRVARLQQLFAPSRLAAAGSVTETRLGLAGAANFIRVYRQQTANIDRVYQDSVAVLSSQMHWGAAQVRQWYARPSAKESPAVVALTGSLLARVDSLLGVLDAQAGAYTVRGNSIAFEDLAATIAYGKLRQQIAATVDSAVAAGAGTSSGPMSYLLQAIGTSRLPRET
jgi:hypothetical protein